MLAQYCRHAVNARFLGRMIQEFRPEWLAETEGLLRYDKLLAMADRGGRGMANLGTKLRMTQQSHYRADKVVKTTTSAKKPWEFGT
jgi:hypothetical protein